MPEYLVNVKICNKVYWCKNHEFMWLNLEWHRQNYTELHWFLETKEASLVMMYVVWQNHCTTAENSLTLRSTKLD